MVYNASPVTSLRDYGDPLRLIRFQLGWAVFGIILAIIVFKVPYSFWQKVAPLLIILAVVLLLAVLVPGWGSKIYGAQRWLRYGWIGIQPAEAAKLAYIIFLSAYFSKKVRFFPFLFITGLLAGIVLFQRDLGTTFVICSIGLAIYFIAGGFLWQIVALIPVIVAATAFLIFTSGYRKARLTVFLNPNIDPQGISYHLNQVLIAIGSGGLFGVGLGESRQKYGYIPEVTTDSIFAVIGNELGFLGSVILVSAFVLLIYRGFDIARAAPDKFSQLVAVGITTWIGLQTFVNLAGLTSLLPLTGVPLPFISYGGSSLVIILVASAILLNISCYTKARTVKAK
jgi:cell division protein FtsW